MTIRTLVSEKLARMLAVLSHPNRLLIVEALAKGEQDVASLQHALGISHSGVSQHLALLRAQALVAERRGGRHVFYRLLQPSLAEWLVEGLRFIEPGEDQAELRAAVRQVRAAWRRSSSKSTRVSKAGG